LRIEKNAFHLQQNLSIMMKKLFLGLAVAGVSLFTLAAAAQPGMAPKRTITVYGLAEKQVEPDEVFTSISIQEYADESGLMIGLKELEPRMLKALNEAGIATADVRVENVSGYGSYQMEGPGFQASKTYVVKTKSIGTINQLLGKLSNAGVSSVNTTYYSHSQVDTYMRELKQQALKTAREKADMLVRAGNEKLGKVVAIEEIEDLGNVTYGGNYARKPMFDAAKPMKEVGLTNISFVASMKVTFEIVE